MHARTRARTCRSGGRHRRWGRRAWRETPSAGTGACPRHRRAPACGSGRTAWRGVSSTALQGKRTPPPLEWRFGWILFSLWCRRPCAQHGGSPRPSAHRSTIAPPRSARACPPTRHSPRRRPSAHLRGPRARSPPPRERPPAALCRPGRHAAPRARRASAPRAPAPRRSRKSHALRSPRRPWLRCLGDADAYCTCGVQVSICPRISGPTLCQIRASQRGLPRVPRSPPPPRQVDHPATCRAAASV